MLLGGENIETIYNLHINNQNIFNIQQDKIIKNILEIIKQPMLAKALKLDKIIININMELLESKKALDTSKAIGEYQLMKNYVQKILINKRNELALNMFEENWSKSKICEILKISQNELSHLLNNK